MALEALVLLADIAQREFGQALGAQLGGLRVDMEDGQGIAALVGHCDVAVLQHRHAFGIAQAEQRDGAQHVAGERQLHQQRPLAGNGEQGPGCRVVGQVRGFVLFQALQRLGVDHHPIARQPDAFVAQLLAGLAFLPPQAGAIVPMHDDGQHHADEHDERRQQPAETGKLGGKGHGRGSTVWPGVFLGVAMKGHCPQPVNRSVGQPTDSRFRCRR